MTTGSIATLDSVRHVPAAFTRKTVPGHALLSGWRSHADGVSHTVIARWPEHHPLYTSHTDHYHPLLFSETIRQALALLSHVAHGVPLDFRLGWDSYDSAVVPAALSTHAPTSDVHLTITHTEVVRRRLGSTHLAAQVTATRDGEPLGIARVRYTAHPPAIYDRLRGAYADARAASARALPPGPALDEAVRGGQTSLENAVLSPLAEPHRWQLRVDTGNRFFFDHAHDHIPGLVFLEAAAQAAHALSGSPRTVPMELDARFLRYVELDAPCWVEATAPRRGGSDVVSTEVTGRQHGKEVFSARVTVKACAPVPA
ncbi:ScbA/BarX family gamma-butyrolactone biosynthesis protein [Streptomyces sp. NPDC127049]|uniref:ScbA/BarX family gamma-butyrolactone biosynthesis protein n=1 Tax=Streptomyces sp. NPDC127049 TaxID=3347118 RepID=UPI0036492936